MRVRRGAGDHSAPRFFRCLMDGALVDDRRLSMIRHLGHRLVDGVPTRWEQIKMIFGWRP